MGVVFLLLDLALLGACVSAPPSVPRTLTRAGSANLRTFEPTMTPTRRCNDAWPGRGPPYLMGRSEGENRRLIHQAQLYNPLTRRFLIEAGIGSGMRVLDVGSGAGDVALLLAELAPS